MAAKASKKKSEVAHSKSGLGFAQVKDWLTEFRQYFVTLPLALGAFLAFKTFVIEKLGLPEWTAWLAFIPPLLVFLFRTVPRLVERRHEQMFIKCAKGEKNASPASYFLIGPYGEDRRDRFTRADGMHVTVLEWLRKADEQILILTGLSGTGKTSLLNAFVIPTLRETKPLCAAILVRSFDNPIEELRRELLRSGVIWDDPPTGMKNLSMADLVRRAVARMRRSNTEARLYALFDQFEELLVLQKEDSAVSVAMREFLKQLLDSPIHGFVVVISVRFDYRVYLESVGVPPIALRKNWHDIPAFTFADSARFIKAPESGLDIAPQRLDHILTEAAAVDGTRGLIRPIILNMVGLVLARIAESPRAEFPTRTLLADDLRAFINQSERHKIARKILPQMLTDADTKYPRSIGDLSRTTGLEPQLILGFLQDLELGGYVRQISHETRVANRIWEISHDFVARLLGPIVRRPFETPWGKVRRVLYPVSVGAWGLAALALIFAAPWLGRIRSEQILRDRFLIFLHSEGFGYLAKEQNPDFNGLRQAIPHLVNFGSVRVFDLSNCKRLYEIDGLKDLKDLENLNLSNCEGLVNVDGLKGLKALNDLDLRNCKRLAKFDGLVGLQALRMLNVSGCDLLTNVDALKDLEGLESLDLSNCKQLTDLGALGSLKALQDLDLSNSGQAQLETLRGLKVMRNLNLSNCKQVANVDALKNLQGLESLHLNGCTQLASIGGLRNLNALENLNLSGCTQLAIVDGLGGLERLETLNLSGCTQLASVDRLKNLKALVGLNLSGCTQLASVDGLKDLKTLVDLDLSGCTQLTNVDELRDLKALQRLDLTGCIGLPAKMFERLQTALPDTDIVY